MLTFSLSLEANRLIQDGSNLFCYVVGVVVLAALASTKGGFRVYEGSASIVDLLNMMHIAASHRFEIIQENRIS